MMGAGRGPPGLDFDPSSPGVRPPDPLSETLTSGRPLEARKPLDQLDHGGGRDRVPYVDSDALARVLVHDGQGSEASAGTQLVGMKSMLQRSFGPPSGARTPWSLAPPFLATASYSQTSSRYRRWTRLRFTA